MKLMFTLSSSRKINSWPDEVHETLTKACPQKRLKLSGIKWSPISLPCQIYLSANFFACPKNHASINAEVRVLQKQAQ